ncbi:MAG TPA: phospholipase D-like domain-containing protein [Thermoanaerobaculia bacterium]|nr:phospholipase D-like domain-containing protein [Thermoanaerobaculia bacterium]
MGNEAAGMPDPGVFLKWLGRLKERDPRLYEELDAKLTQRQQNESVSFESASPEAVTRFVVETIVRSGRPALYVKDNRIDHTSEELDQTAKAMVDRLRGAAPVLEPLIPLVGRIDVANHQGGITYVGTGWYLAENIVVTNRHVAELIAQWDGRQFVFKPGTFGEELKVSVDFRHEHGIAASDSVPVQSVIYIERDGSKADFALLRVDRKVDGVQPKCIPVAKSDAKLNTNIAVVGYPARAPDWIIADQAWMDRIYGKTYDVKRIAPGLMTGPSRGWATHDATTLGGNSGSVVLDMDTGEAVGLHFAGAYMIENYCVPASVISDYAKFGTSPLPIPAPQPTPKPKPADEDPQPQAPSATTSATISTGEITITIPVTIKVSLGTPVVGSGAAQTQPQVTPPAKESSGVLEAARALHREIRGNGVLAVRHGYLIEGNRLSNTACLVVAADPSQLEDVRTRVPRSYGGFPIDVRSAPLRDQDVEVAEELFAEAGMTIAYDDDVRKGEGFSFEWVEEKMDVLLHVGPERSWSVLSDFLAGTKRQLVSAIYEFHAKHIADALEGELAEGTTLKLVMAPQSHDPKSGHIAQGEFDRSERFAKWEQKFGDERFLRVFVPIGNGGLVAKSYHIKVTVRDDDTFWLSSGNWKKTSQPAIPAANLDNPRETSKAGNREWHVVIKNRTLAQRFQNHILADYERSLDLGGTPESVIEEKFVDVPVRALESIAFEAAPQKVFESLRVNRMVRVKPLLTPDRKGEVYSSAVLKHIRSAKTQLLFQNQYILVDAESKGLFGQLVDALVEKSNEIEDVRVLLRSTDTFWDNVAELKRRGMDVNRCVRRMNATHTKGIIVDGKRVLVGSHNWSSLGVTLNRDASLIFDDEEVAQYYAAVFDEDWNRTKEIAESVTALAEEMPRMARGDAPPRGFVRIPLAEYLEG